MSEATDWVKCPKCDHYQIIPILYKNAICEKCKEFIVGGEIKTKPWFYIDEDKFYHFT